MVGKVFVRRQTTKMSSSTTTRSSGAPPRPDWEGARPRLDALQRLAVKTLPTRRRVAWDLFGVVVGLGFSVWIWTLADGRALFNVVGAVLVLLCIATTVRTWERWRSMRSGKIATGVVSRLTDHWSVGMTDTATDVAVGVIAHQYDDVLDKVTDVIADVSGGKRSAERRAREVEKLSSLIKADIAPWERPLLVAPVHLAPHGIRRTVPFMTLFLGTALVNKRGIFTLTDHRVLFHKQRIGSEARLYLAVPVAELNVTDWFKGIGPATERWQFVLILKRRGRSFLRFNFYAAWKKAGRAAFELLASVSTEPPQALASYWRDVPVPASAGKDPTRVRPQRRRGRAVPAKEPSPSSRPTRPLGRRGHGKAAPGKAVSSKSRRKRTAGLAIVSAVLLAAIGAGVAISANSADPTQPPTSTNDPHAPDRAAPAPTNTAVRSTAEGAVIDYLSEKGDTCTSSGAREAGAKRALGGVTCDLRGADAVYAFHYDTIRNLKHDYSVDTQELTRGVCSGTHWDRNGPWYYKGERKRSGQLACFDDPDGIAWLEWTDYDSRVFAWITRKDGNHRKLYRAWLRAF